MIEATRIWRPQVTLPSRLLPFEASQRESRTRNRPKRTRTFPILGLMIAAILTAVSGCTMNRTRAQGPSSRAAPAPPAVAPDVASTVQASPTNAAPAAPQPASPSPQPAIATQKMLSGRTVVVDPGHNGGNASNPAYINQMIYNGRER